MHCLPHTTPHTFPYHPYHHFPVTCCLPRFIPPPTCPHCLLLTLTSLIWIALPTQAVSQHLPSPGPVCVPSCLPTCLLCHTPYTPLPPRFIFPLPCPCPLYPICLASPYLLGSSLSPLCFLWVCWSAVVPTPPILPCSQPFTTPPVPSSILPTIFPVLVGFCLPCPLLPDAPCHLPSPSLCGCQVLHLTCWGIYLPCATFCPLCTTTFLTWLGCLIRFWLGRFICSLITHAYSPHPTFPW